MAKNSLQDLVAKTSDTTKETPKIEPNPELTLDVSTMTPMEEALYQSVITSCITQFAQVQGFKTQNNEKWWINSLSEAHRLARATVITYRKVNNELV